MYIQEFWLIMINFIFFLILCLTFTFNQHVAIGLDNLDDLPNCKMKSHCVFVDLEVINVEEAFAKSMQILDSVPRTKIVEQNDSYIHLEVTSRVMRYVDDLEIKAFPDKGILQVRSESRVGVGDMGVNQRRVDDLAYRLMTNQI